MSEQNQTQPPSTSNPSGQTPSISDRLILGQYLTQEEYNALPDTANIKGVALSYAKQGNIVIPVVAIFADSWSKKIYDIAKKYREQGLPVILMRTPSRPHIMYVPVQSSDELEQAIRVVLSLYRDMISYIYSGRSFVEQILRALN